MKKILLFVALLIGGLSQSQAQRYAVVDTKYILDKLPEYKEAQKRLKLTTSKLCLTRCIKASRQNRYC